MISSVLSRFVSLGGQYVSWKNNHELDLVLSGASDLDIYVPLSQKQQFFDLAQKENWIIVKNPVADYPYVYHFYNIDKELNVYHLHVYFKIITGESWLKEYDFPLGDFLLGSKVKHPSGIYILNGEAQAYLFVLRHFIKGYSSFSRLLYKKELKSYQREWDLCKESYDPCAYPDLLDFSGFIQQSGLKGSFGLPSKKIAKRVRTRLKKYLWLPSSKLGWLRLKNLKKRLFNKLLYKEKKILPKQGFILAFSGADGVGKSTMSKTIGESYKSFLTVKNVMLGRPQGVLVEKLRSIINRKHNNAGSGSSEKERSDNPVSFKKALSAVYLAKLRYQTAKTAQKYRDKGYLVISDRWPTLQNNKMDGPKLESNRLRGIKKKLAVREEQYYQKLKSADLCLILKVPVNVAVDRNKKRIKAGKETDEEIKQRHLENARHNPKAKEIVRFDNNGDLEMKREKLITLIQQYLFHNR